MGMRSCWLCEGLYELRSRRGHVALQVDLHRHIREHGRLEERAAARMPPPAGEDPRAPPHSILDVLLDLGDGSGVDQRPIIPST